MKQWANNRGAKVIQVIRVETIEGSGTEDDPINSVVSYFTLDGTLIGHTDKRERLLRGEGVLK